MENPAVTTKRPPAQPARAIEVELKDADASARTSARPAIDGSRTLAAVGDRAENGLPGTTSWFERVYEEAGGDCARVPWASNVPHPCLLAWLNAEAAARVRPGSRAIVVGSGLGDDVIELLQRGYDAIGFDVSQAAIDWARRRFPDASSAFLHADLFSLPTKYRHRFELVVEINTLQAVHPSQREAAAQAIGALCGPRGLVVIICHARDDQATLENVNGPPWPLCQTELLALMEAAGLKPARPLDDFEDDQVPPIRRLRGVFERV